MSFNIIPGPYKLQAGPAWGSVEIIAKGGKLLATVWSASNPPSMEQAEANARALLAALEPGKW